MPSSLSLRSQVSIGKFPNVALKPSIVPARALSFAEIVHYGFPHGKMDVNIRKWKIRNLKNLFRGTWRILAAKKIGVPHIYGQLCLAIISPDRRHRKDYGLVSLRMITSSGAEYVVDAFQGLKSLVNFNYHGIGGGSTPESVSDTALGSEFALAYSPINTRATGIQTESSSTTYQSIGFITVTDTVTITEHGLFSQAATGGGTMLDRTAVASEVVFDGFVVQTDYRLTIATGT